MPFLQQPSIHIKKVAQARVRVEIFKLVAKSHIYPVFGHDSSTSKCKGFYISSSFGTFLLRITQLFNKTRVIWYENQSHCQNFKHRTDILLSCKWANQKYFTTKLQNLHILKHTVSSLNPPSGSSTSCNDNVMISKMATIKICMLGLLRFWYQWAAAAAHNEKDDHIIHQEIPIQ